MELTAHFKDIIKPQRTKILEQRCHFCQIFLLGIKIELFFLHGHHHKPRKNGAKNFWDRPSLKSPVYLCIIQIETCKTFLSGIYRLFFN